MEHTSISQMIISFVLLLLLGGITAFFAEKRGRSPNIWFFLGMFLGLLGLIILFLLPSYSAEESKEELKKDPEKTGTQVSEPPPPLVEEKLWFYVDQNRQQCGPVAFSFINELINKNELNSTTYVWTEGMDSWKKINEL